MSTESLEAHIIILVIIIDTAINLYIGMNVWTMIDCES